MTKEEFYHQVEQICKLYALEHTKYLDKDEDCNIEIQCKLYPWAENYKEFNLGTEDFRPCWDFYISVDKTVPYESVYEIAPEDRGHNFDNIPVYHDDNGKYFGGL